MKKNIERKVSIAALLVFCMIIASSLMKLFVINDHEMRSSLNMSAEEITILNPMNNTYMTGMSGYFPGTYSFEDEESGLDPSNWYVNEDGGFVDVKDDYLGHNEVIELCKNSGGLVFCRNQFENRTSGIIEFWICFSRSDQIFSIRMFGDGYYSGSIELLLDDGFLKVQDGYQLQNIMPYINDTWYHFKIEWDVSRGNWVLNVNDVEQGGYGFYGTPSNFNKILFGIAMESPLDSYGYLDAIGYSWDQQYEIGDNLHEGLLVSFETALSFDKLWCELDGVHYKDLTGNSTIPMTRYGMHRLQVCGMISSTKYASSIVYFTTLVDRWGPSILIKSPITNSIHIFCPACEIEVSDPNGVNDTYYRLESSGSSSGLVKWEGSIGSDIWLSMTDGEVTITFFSQDDLGNWSSASVVIMRSLKLLILIIGLPLLVGMAAMVVWAFLRKKKKLRETIDNMRYEVLKGKAVIVNGKKYKNTSLEGLVLRDLGISNIAEIFGIEHVSHLTKLNLASNKLTSFQGLDRLDELEELNVENNEITDLFGIEKLHDLKVLNLNGNGIKEIIPLSSLVHLERLHLRETGVSSIEPLRNLPHLNSLYVRGSHGIAYSSRDEFFSRIGYVDIRPSPTRVQWSSKTKMRSTEWKPIYGYLIAELIIALVCTFIFIGILDYFLADLNYWDTLFRYFFVLFAAGLFIGLVILLIWDAEMG